MEREDVLVVEDKQFAGDALIYSSSFFLCFFFVPLFFFFLYLTHGQKMLEELPECMGVGVL